MAIEMRGGRRPVARLAPRMRRVEDHGVVGLVSRVVRVARRGLPLSYDPEAGLFAQTMRRSSEPGPLVGREGTSLRYTAIAALGLGCLDVADQQEALGGLTAADLVDSLGPRCLEHDSDPGAVALAVWAAAEVGGDPFADGVLRMRDDLASGRPIPTVDLAWITTAAVAVGPSGADVAAEGVARLLAGQGARGIYPHVLPAQTQNRWRRHVGSFADQVYPIQALARASAAGHAGALAAAERTADRICELQGPDGQWWWHYDARTGDVVEGFPVYAVHQHAMAPMVLFDLADAGGTDHVASIVRGLGWLEQHPEIDGEVVDDYLGVIWRKAGRREPRKAVRRMSAVTTSMRPGARLPGLDRMFPPVRIDHECRPYELGWLLHAWLSPRGARP